jgi:hypothetical protein
MSSKISQYFGIEQINIVAPYNTSQQPRFVHKHLLTTKFYFRFLLSKYTNKLKNIERKDMHYVLAIF